MTEKKRKIIVYAIFVIAVGWGIMNNPFNRKKPQLDNNQAANQTIQSATLAGPANPDIKLNLSDGWGSDPFAQKNATIKSAAPQETIFNLTAISESSGEFWALINGLILAAGDSIEGWTVAQVTRGEAILTKNGKTISLIIKGV